MKILVISQHYYPENFRITNICETLVEVGHSVTVICGYPNYPEGYIYDGYKGKNGKRAHKDETINGVKIHRCFEIPRGKSPLKLFLNYYSVCLSMKKKALNIKEKFDCVFVSQTSPVMVGWAGIAFSKKYRVPCVLYCYDLWPASLAAGGIKEKSLIYRVFTKVSRRVYENVTHICITSRNFRNYLVENHGINDSSISYLPQYCEDVFQNVASASHEGVNFVFAGNIGKVQSVETIIKAASLVLERTDIKIHIVGDGSNLELCKKLANELGLKNVIFYGKQPIDKMPSFYSIADAMIVTLSKNDLISKTLPGKVQSYMAAGKPIIAAADGETQILVHEARCGYTCNSEDYVALSECFANFKKDRYARQLGENARQYYLSHFSKEVFISRLVEVLSNENFDD